MKGNKLNENMFRTNRSIQRNYAVRVYSFSFCSNPISSFRSSELAAGSLRRSLNIHVGIRFVSNDLHKSFIDSDKTVYIYDTI